VKILYICADLGVPVLGRKGASVHVRQMIEAMTRAGHQVVLAAQILQKSRWEKAAVLDVPIIEVRPASEALATISAVKEFNARLQLDNSMPGDLRRIVYNRDLELDLARRFESDPPDIIYERGSLYGMGGVALGKRLKVPVIIELNAPLVIEQSAYRSTLFGGIAEEAERWILKSADAVFVVSQNLREHALGLGADPARVRVVPNGVDAARFFPAEPDKKLRASLGITDEKVLGFVGGLRPWHGVEILPDLLAGLASAHPRLKLLIVGEGPLRTTLTAAFAERKQLDQVIFAGSQPHEEIAGFIRQFDIALAPYPTPNHTFYFSPLKLFEYLACGIPVVAANIGQISEIVKDRETGWLYPPGDLSALIDSCRTLLNDRELRLRLGKSGAAMVHANHTWDRNVRMLEETVASLRSSVSQEEGA
jgi:glycosyltransferase involved in cell wall biosynthesis